MRRSTRRIVSILLVICMCAAMLPAILPSVLPEVSAVSPGYSVSSAYRSSSYYSSLLEVELTGDQREDIINVALSQVGYSEGSYTGDTGGADDGSYDNYTEYNYWYHNYIDSGMPVGGGYAPWCATFVSWCAEMANIPTSILQRSTAAGHSSYYFNVNFYSGSSTLAASRDDDSYFMGYNYTPKKGDLFFTRSWSHVGLVIDSDGTYVTTVEGNTNDGGSAEGCGVFVRTRYVDDLYFGVPEYVESYVSSCTYYPAYCQITIDSDSPINSQPCSVSTEADSVNLGTAVAGQTYTATALYRNGYGNYWYRVETDLGETSYVYAGDTTYVKQIISDITLKDHDVPSAHVSGNTFSVTGTVSSAYNRLDTVACYIYSGFDHGDEAVTGDSVTVNGTRYVLDNSTIDYNTSFGALDNGAHTYEISTTYTNYYATSNTTIASNKGTIQLLSEYFMVIPSSVDQSSCSHSYSTTTIQAATCETGGSAVKSCSKCGVVQETTVAATGHAYGSWTIVDATCTTDGSKTHTCRTCGKVETQVITATGHAYSKTSYPGSCVEHPRDEYICANCGHSYNVYPDSAMSGWTETLPEGIDMSLVETKTQYRYSDYETTTSAQSSLSGYTQTGSTWVKSGSGTVNYVDSWSAGFSTGSSLYSQYNKASSKVTASETSTTKTVIDSDATVGYLYHHWCYADSYYSVQSSGDGYTTFHAFYSTTAPGSLSKYDASDGSYYYPNSDTCSNSEWWWPTTVKAQKYTTYDKQYTYGRWGSWSGWSDTPVEATDTRKVETRTVYRYVDADLTGHNYVNGTCTLCGTTCQHNWSGNKCTICGLGCAHPSHNTSGICSSCGKTVSHSYTEITVAPTCTSGGYITHKCSGCGNSYNSDYTAALGHDYVAGVCNNCGGQCSHSNWDNGSCTTCGMTCRHSWSNNTCTACGKSYPVRDYYLFGYINGSDYACEGDYQNLGKYKFVNGKLTASFATDSYVAVKSGDNADWYMTATYYGESVTAATLFNTSTGAAEKLFVPGGKNIVFTLQHNGDDTFTLSYVIADCTHPSHDTNGDCTGCGTAVGHSYKNGKCSVCGAAEPGTVKQPTLTLKYPSLSFESEILYNIYFSGADMDSVVEMGMITFNERLTNGTIADAVDVIPGYSGSDGVYMVQSLGIPAKALGDTVFMKVYAKLSDGSYVYSDVAGYNAVAYAKSVLNGNNSDEMKALVVSMLNYGTEAQLFFGHNTDNLMNSFLTAQQQAMIPAYDESLVDPVVGATTAKTANFPRTTSVLKNLYASVSFDGAFSINYYVLPSVAVDDGITFYYWDAETYATASKLTKENATGSMTMTYTDAETPYWACVPNIAAKYMDTTYYAAGVFESNGTTYTTGVISYSLGRYCESVAAKDGNEQQALAKATAVYGWCAEEYFASI